VKDAETHAIVGECEAARAEASAGLDLSRDNLTLERASRALALCDGAREAEALLGELKRRFPEATLTVDLSIPVTSAAAALRQGAPARAIELLEQVRRYDHAPSAEFWPAYLRGEAYLQLKEATAAATEFQGILAHRGEVPASVLYPLARLGLARALAMAGDASARTAYEDFVSRWNGADPDLPVLKDARAELSRLR
jgi:hypothetical protein